MTDTHHLEAEIARLTAERVELDRLWTIKHDIAKTVEAERDEAKAEIARYKTEREYIHGFIAGFEESQDEADAEIARLREALQRIADAPAWGAPHRWETTPSEVRQLARAALKPDTGEGTSQ